MVLTYELSVVLDDDRQSWGVGVEDTLQVRHLHVPLILGQEGVQTRQVGALQGPDLVTDVLSMLAQTKARKKNKK